MVTKAEARRIAQAAILDIWSVEGDEPIIFDESTLDREWGWVFFWGSRRYAETRLSRFALAGNAPVLVKRVDGSAHFTTTAEPVEEFLSRYEDEFGLVAPVWCLVIDEVKSVELLMKLRRALNWSVVELGRVKDSLPGCVRRGRRREMQVLCDALLAEGIKAKVEEAAGGSGEA